MKRGLSFSLPVTAVVLAIGYIYFSTVFVFIERWFGLMSSPGIMNASVFTAVALMCVFNYAVAIFTNPGGVPSTYMPDVEDSDNPIHEIKRKDQRGNVIGRSKAINDLEIQDIKDGGDLRYCQKCSHLKPPRAHHCRVCKRCVLRMVLLVGSLTVEPQKDEQQSEGYFRTIYVISGLLLVPMSVTLVVLLGWHIYLILQNKTTIEYHEGVRALWLAKKGGHVYKHPYDIGAYENLTTVLGPNIFCWLCPTSGHVGSGLRFRTAYDTMTIASTS